MDKHEIRVIEKELKKRVKSYKIVPSDPRYDVMEFVGSAIGDAIMLVNTMRGYNRVLSARYKAYYRRSMCFYASNFVDRHAKVVERVAGYPVALVAIEAVYYDIVRLMSDIMGENPDGFDYRVKDMYHQSKIAVDRIHLQELERRLVRYG